MKLNKIILLGLMFILSGAVTTTYAGVVPSGGEPIQETIIIQSDFGVFTNAGTDEEELVPTKTVPLKVGQVYGWYIKVDTIKAKIRWREVFTLPSAPATWGETGAESGQSISDDKRVSIIEREVEPVDGVIFNTWEVAAGDPKGHYVLRVIIDDNLERVFEFEVE